jgi:hypothetical protein
MKIKIGTGHDPEWTEINVGSHEVVIQDAFVGVGIETDLGLFGISARDAGIEVILDGKLVWCSSELLESNNKKQKKIWTCKIGEIEEDKLPPGSDLPMRKAIEDEYLSLTGEYPDFIFSGWGGELDKYERMFIDDMVLDSTAANRGDK